jgi:hypothetical protein
MNIKVSERLDILPRHSVLSLGLSLAAGLLVISSIFVVFGVNPLYAIAKIFSGSFGSIYGIKETITKAIPLILIGSGLTLAFRAKFWNIGAADGGHFRHLGRVELGTPPARTGHRSADVFSRVFGRWPLGADPGHPQGKIFHQ